MRLRVLASLAAAAVLAGCGSSSSPTATVTTTETVTTTSSSGLPSCGDRVAIAAYHRAHPLERHIPCQ